MIIPIKARQAPPRSVPDGPQLNQLTGGKSLHSPKFQGSGYYTVEMLDEPEPQLPPQPVNAWTHGDNGPDVTLIPEEEDEAVLDQQPFTYRPPRRRTRNRSNR